MLIKQGSTLIDPHLCVWGKKEGVGRGPQSCQNILVWQKKPDSVTQRSLVIWTYLMTHSGALIAIDSIQTKSNKTRTFHQGRYKSKINYYCVWAKRNNYVVFLF